jgi:hypothetical protein
LHFDFDDGLLKKHNELHLHIPLRHPMAVAASWARRDKNPDRMIAAYRSMFAHLYRPHTLYRMELLPLLDGYADTDNRENEGVTHARTYQMLLASEIIEPHIDWFAAQYPDPLSTDVDTRPQVEIRSPHDVEQDSDRREGSDRAMATE